MVMLRGKEAMQKMVDVTDFCIVEGKTNIYFRIEYQKDTTISNPLKISLNFPHGDFKFV